MMKKRKELKAYAGRKDVLDLRCVGVKEAADIFGWSITKFRQKYRDVLHPEISTARTSHGKQFLLTDVIKCAFPEADNTAIHVVARNETRRLAISRKRKRKIKEEVNPDEVKDQSSDEVEDQPGEKLMRGLLVLLHESHKNGESIDFDELCSMYDILSPYLRSRIREPAKPKTSRRRSRLVHIPNQPENFFMAVRYFTEQNPEMQIKIYRRPEEETDQFRYSQVDSYTVNQVGSPGSIESGLREGYGAGDYILNFEDGLGLVYAQYTFAIG